MHPLRHLQDLKGQIHALDGIEEEGMNRSLLSVPLPVRQDGEDPDFVQTCQLHFQSRCQEFPQISGICPEDIPKPGYLRRLHTGRLDRQILMQISQSQHVHTMIYPDEEHQRIMQVPGQRFRQSEGMDQDQDPEKSRLTGVGFPFSTLQ